MFKDDYKAANEQITASSDLKKRTLEKMTEKKQSKQHSYMRYGLVCASFLFIVSMFPVLYGSNGLTNDNPDLSNDTSSFGVTMPQTGVDESAVYKNDVEIKEFQKTAKIMEADIKQKQEEIGSLIEKTKEPVADEKKEIEIKDEYEKEIKKKTEEVKSIVSQAVAMIPVDSISFNKVVTPFTIDETEGKFFFSSEDGYYEELLTNQQVIEYLGISPTPTFLPKDMELVSPIADNHTTSQKIVFDKDGVVAFDNFDYLFLQPQLTREFDPLRQSLSITCAKDKLPLECGIYKTDSDIASFINGWTVNIYHKSNAFASNDGSVGMIVSDEFIAEFLYKDAGFRIVAQNLTQEDFISVISSIILKCDTAQPPVTSELTSSDVTSSNVTSSDITSSTQTSSDVTAQGSSAIQTSSQAGFTPEDSSSPSGPKK